MSSSFEQAFLAPYGKQYCTYFYILTVITLAFLVAALFHSLYLFFQGEMRIVELVLSILGPLVIYFNNRILYSMCQASLI